MSPDLLRLIGITAGAIVSGPLVLLCVRAALFFGSMSNTVKTLGEFVSEARRQLADHESRITIIEAERRFERRHHSRRDSDSPPQGAEQ